MRAVQGQQREPPIGDGGDRVVARAERDRRDRHPGEGPRLCQERVAGHVEAAHAAVVVADDDHALARRAADAGDGRWAARGSRPVEGVGGDQQQTVGRGGVFVANPEPGVDAPAAVADQQGVAAQQEATHGERGTVAQQIAALRDGRLTQVAGVEAHECPVLPQHVDGIGVAADQHSGKRDVAVEIGNRGAPAPHRRGHAPGEDVAPARHGADPQQPVVGNHGDHRPDRAHRLVDQQHGAGVTAGHRVFDARLKTLPTELADRRALYRGVVEHTDLTLGEGAQPGRHVVVLIEIGFEQHLT